MFKQLIAALLVIGLVGAAQATTPTPIKLGIGAFGGVTIPIVQDDQSEGTVFGVRARFKLSFIVLEPNATFSKFGDPGTIDGVDLGVEGSKLNSFGVDATLGGAPGLPGVKPFFIVGIGSYKMENEKTKFDESNIGYSGGLGIGIGLASKFDLDVRGVAIVIPQGDGGSKKSAAITGGLTFNF